MPVVADPCECGGVPTKQNYVSDGMLDYLECPKCGNRYGGMFDFPEWAGLARSWNLARRIGESPTRRKMAADLDTPEKVLEACCHEVAHVLSSEKLAKLQALRSRIPAPAAPDPWSGAERNEEKP